MKMGTTRSLWRYDLVLNIAPPSPITRVAGWLGYDRRDSAKTKVGERPFRADSSQDIASAVRKLATRSRQRVKAYKARLACARVTENTASPPNAADSTKWRTGEDETKNRRVIVMPVNLR